LEDWSLREERSNRRVRGEGMIDKDRIDLTPDNFCYLSKCPFFISNIESTGCKIDYMRDGQRQEVDGLCPLAMERSFRADDPDWQPNEKKMLQKLREVADEFEEDKEMIDRMGKEAYADALDKCSDMAQKVYDAKIKYERLQYALQEMKASCFGQQEK
jgi:hypothetical protein